MKLICIDIKAAYMTPSHNHLTKGKIYEVSEKDLKDWPYGGIYLLINDIGKKAFYFMKGFKPIEQHRTQQLDKII